MAFEGVFPSEIFCPIVKNRPPPQFEGFFENLPEDIFYYMCTYLRWKDVHSLQLTGRFCLKKISDENSPLWEEFLRRYFPHSYVNRQSQESLKDTFRQCLTITHNVFKMRSVKSSIEQKNAECHHLRIENSVLYWRFQQDLNIWDLKKKECTLKIAVRRFSRIIIRNGKAYCIKEGVIEILHIKSQLVIQTFHCYKKASFSYGQRLAVSDDKLIASFPIAHDKWAIKVWDLCHANLLQKMKIARGCVASLLVEGDLLYVGLNTGKIEIWSIQEGKLKQTLSTDPGVVRHMEMAQNLLVAQVSNKIKAWKRCGQITFVEISAPRFTETIRKFRVLDQQVYFVVVEQFLDCVYVWDLENNTITKVVSVLYHSINDLKFHNGCLYLALNNGKIMIYDFSKLHTSSTCTLL